MRARFPNVIRGLLVRESPLPANCHNQPGGRNASLNQAEIAARKEGIVHLSPPAPKGLHTVRDSKARRQRPARGQSAPIKMYLNRCTLIQSRVNQPVLRVELE
jgi:hypothetical protein